MLWVCPGLLVGCFKKLLALVPVKFCFDCVVKLYVAIVTTGKVESEVVVEEIWWRRLLFDVGKGLTSAIEEKHVKCDVELYLCL